MYQDIELQHYFASYQNKTNLGEYLQNFQLFVHEKLCSASILYQPTLYEKDRKPTFSFSFLLKHSLSLPWVPMKCYKETACPLWIFVQIGILVGNN